MTPPRAAGMRMSQSSTKIESGCIASAPWNPFTPRASRTCFMRLGTSSPLLFLIAPVMSLTATMIPPCSLIN